MFKTKLTTHLYMQIFIYELTHHRLGLLMIWLGCFNSACSSCRGFFSCEHGPHTRYVKLWFAHEPGMPGTFSPPPTSNRYFLAIPACITARAWRHARAVMHVGIVNLRWQEKRSRYSRRMRNPYFYVYDRPMKSSVVPVINATHHSYRPTEIATTETLTHTSMW